MVITTEDKENKITLIKHVKLIDFGFAKFLKNDNNFMDIE